MTRPERTGSRTSDLRFSNRHRELNGKFYVTDIDFVEYGYRDGVPVPLAMYDVKDIPECTEDIGEYIKYKMSESRSLDGYRGLAGESFPIFVLFQTGDETPLYVAVPLNDACTVMFHRLHTMDWMEVCDDYVIFDDGELDTFIGIMRGDYH